MESSWSLLVSKLYSMYHPGFFVLFCFSPWTLFMLVSKGLLGDCLSVCVFLHFYLWFRIKTERMEFPGGHAVKVTAVVQVHNLAQELRLAELPSTGPECGQNRNFFLRLKA